MRKRVGVMGERDEGEGRTDLGVRGRPYIAPAAAEVFLLRGHFTLFLFLS